MVLESFIHHQKQMAPNMLLFLLFAFISISQISALLMYLVCFLCLLLIFISCSASLGSSLLAEKTDEASSRWWAFRKAGGCRAGQGKGRKQAVKFSSPIPSPFSGVWLLPFPGKFIFLPRVFSVILLRDTQGWVTEGLHLNPSPSFKWQKHLKTKKNY